VHFLVTTHTTNTTLTDRLMTSRSNYILAVVGGIGTCPRSMTKQCGTTFTTLVRISSAHKTANMKLETKKIGEKFEE